MPAPVAPQPGREWALTIGAFNLGMDQNMLTQGNVQRHCDNFVRVCAKLVDEGELDVFFACEVGGADAGFAAAGINVQKLLHRPFGTNVCLWSRQAYLAVWGFNGSPDTAIVTEIGHEFTDMNPNGRSCFAAISRFVVKACGVRAFLLEGNMHIRCGQAAP